MNNAMSILFHAFVDSFRPKMLMLTLVSVAIASVFWLVLIWLSVDPLVNAAMWALSFLGLDFSAEAVATDAAFLGWLKFILVPLAVFGLLWPIVATSAVLLAGLYVTPPVVNYLTDKEFLRGIEKKGDSGFVMSLWITLKAVVVFLMAWILTLPLWLIPGMAFVLPVLLTAYLLMTVMRFDSLAGHATKLEMAEVKKRDSTSAWLIGLVCAFLSFIPPILLIMPVMSALAFTRHYMGALTQVRQSKTIDLPVIQSN